MIGFARGKIVNNRFFILLLSKLPVIRQNCKILYFILNIETIIYDGKSKKFSSSKLQSHPMNFGIIEKIINNWICDNAKNF